MARAATSRATSPCGDPRAQRRSLKSVVVLSALDDQGLAAVEQKCRWSRFKPGAQIIRHQEPGAEVGFIVRGRVRVIIYSKDGRAVTFRDIGMGEMFGELAALDGRGRSASIEALDECEIAFLQSKDFWTLLLEHPEAARVVLLRMSSLVRMLSDRIFEFSTLAVRNRIQAELLRMARQIDQHADMVLIERPPSHSEIASRISTVREAVTREISHLTRIGVLRKAGRSIRVVSLSRLEGMVNKAGND